MPGGLNEILSPLGVNSLNLLNSLNLKFKLISDAQCMAIVVVVVVGSVVVNVGEVKAVLLGYLPFHADGESLFVEVELVAQVVAKLVGGIGSPCAVAYVVFQAKARTEIVLVLRSLGVKLTFSIKILHAVIFTFNAVIISRYSAIFSLHCMSRHKMCILVTLTHCKDEFVFADFGNVPTTTYVKRGAVLASPIGIFNVIFGTTNIFRFIFSVFQVVVADKRVTTRDREPLERLVGQSSINVVARKVVELVLRTHAEPHVSREFFRKILLHCATEPHAVVIGKGGSGA